MATRKASSSLTTEASPLLLRPPPPEIPNVSARLDRQPPGKGLTRGSITVNGHTYRFNSGTRTHYSVPQGWYLVRGYVGDREGPFKLNGVGFSFVIEDINRPGSDKMYDKRPRRDRTLLRIHPDGSPEGSAGCIALVGSAATLRRFIRDMNKEIDKPGVCRLSVV